MGVLEMAHNITATTEKAEKVASLFYEDRSAYSKAIYDILHCQHLYERKKGDQDFISVPKEIFKQALDTLEEKLFDVFGYVSDSKETRMQFKELKQFLNSCYKAAKKGNIIIVKYN